MAKARWFAVLLVVLALGVAPQRARGQPAESVTVLRFGAVAPSGTAWAREGEAFARGVERATAGAVRVRWVLGGIAGNDFEMGARVLRGQLDGLGSAGVYCERLAPSLRALEVKGLYRDRDEWNFVMNKLRPLFNDELAQSGFTNLGEAYLGSNIVLSRWPIQSFDDLKRLNVWVWDEDGMSRAMLGAFGMRTTPLPIEQAGVAYDRGAIDGFYALPVAALAFQWSTSARYFWIPEIDYQPFCLLVATRALDRLPIPQQLAIRAEGAKNILHFEDVGREQEKLLVSSLFERQGLVRLSLPSAVKERLIEEARHASERLGARAVPQPLIDRVRELIATYRRDHRRD